VPVFHRALAAAAGFSQPVAIVNIGGVANLSFIAPGEEPIACDTGPGNGLLDDLMLKRRGAAFDRDGATASRGKADGVVLSELLAHPFFLAPPPKSLDRNDFSGALVDGLAIEDAAATLTAFTAASIVGVLPLLPSRPSLAIVCGGGARNKTLMRELADQLPCPSFWRKPSAGRATFPMTTGVDKPLEGGVIAEPGEREVRSPPT
jgi:anhydro-N-acetylmuramic acid kinase